jgi:Ca2+-binding RTX toxin-like protein
MQLESLERRRLFSVSVTETYPGYYEVQGDEAANVISASVSQTNSTFALDGTTYTDVSYITVHGNGGDDQISLTSVDGYGYVGASVTGDDGNDQITLNFDGGVWGGAGNDVIRLSDSFRGETYGDDGDDQIYLSGECIDAEIQGGAGNDLIDCTNNNYGVVAYGGVGIDTVYGSAYGDQLYGDEGDDFLYGGAGNDDIYLEGSDQVHGGDGYDVLYVHGSQQGTNDVEEVYYY